MKDKLEERLKYVELYPGSLHQWVKLTETCDEILKDSKTRGLMFKRREKEAGDYRVLEFTFPVHFYGVYVPKTNDTPETTYLSFKIFDKIRLCSVNKESIKSYWFLNHSINQQ